MQLQPGKESYQQDSNTLIRKLSPTWWNDLDEAIQKEKSKLSKGSNIILASLLRGLDWIIRTLLLSGSHYIVIKRNKAAILGDRSQWPFYQQLVDQGDSEKIFKTPSAIDLNTISTKTTRKLSDGEIVQLRAPSSFEPINPYFKDTYWQHHDHRNLNCELWRHDGEARPTFVFMHGYDADAHEINRVIFSAKKLYLDGCNICFFRLPFHTGKLGFSRQTLNFFGHGPAYTSEVFAHAVHDCRALISHFLDQGIASKVGVAGISLGGFVSTLVISSESRLDCATLIAPVFNLPESFMEWFPLAGLFNQLLAEENISMQEFRHAYALCNVLSYEPKIDSDKILLLSGVYDLVALPKYVKLLGEHWQKCEIQWFKYSHVGMTKINPFYAEIHAHLKKTQFLE